MMTNCEEPTCVQVQSAICLHCLRRLCSIHILVHSRLLLKQGDDLDEQITELTEQINISLQQIHSDREEAIHKLNIWRQNQIDQMGNTYAEKLQIIDCRKNRLTKLEDELIQRLTKEAKEPLEQMQRQQTTNIQSLQSIRQVIANVTRDTAQLEFCLKDSSTSIANTTMANKSHLLQSNTSYQKYPSNNHTNSSDLQPLITAQSPSKESTCNQATTMHTIATASSSSKPKITTATSQGISSPLLKVPTASATTSLIIKSCSMGANKNLAALFKNVSGSNDQKIEEYIIQKLYQVTNKNNMRVLLLSFLKAWHWHKSPTIYNHNVLHYHINNIKNYIKSDEQKLIVICVIQEFVDSCKYDETKSSEILTDLLKFFFNHQCITKENILTWYKNGARYGYNGFQKAKLWTKSFVNELNNNIESKQTLIFKPPITGESLIKTD